ncbi:MAG: LysM peptidoglycan-binding domain-containing protein [Proteobacteria bacterium]|nr:LysM peptidoglycan-binding domain-containing protein [Pseudomonadota bacterium]
MRLFIIFMVGLSLLTACATTGTRPAGEEPGAMKQGASTTVPPGRDQFKPGPLFDQALREKVAAELELLEGAAPKIPITINDDVKQAMQFFLTDARKFMIRAVGRSSRYLPMMKRVLKEKGLPTDLAYLPLIESGYQVEAMSPAKAAGLWQFIPATGKRYGLKIDDFRDERLHPEKATRAAADYLCNLHQMFESWYLAAAAYNAGEGKILKGLKKYNATNFWEIKNGGDYLRNETKEYVPKFIAAIILAKDPEAFGLSGIKYEKPLEYDVVTVSQPTDLDLIARLAGVEAKEIEALNPHLNLWCTPLFETDYPVNVPKGKGADILEKLAKVPDKDRMKFSAHKVEARESLKVIARTYGLSESSLRKFNGLRRSYLKKGQIIRIPIGRDVYQARQKEYQRRLEAEKARYKGMGRIVYTVKAGDNPWMIARKFDVNWKNLTEWNDIKDVRGIHPGQKLVIYMDDAQPEVQAPPGAAVAVATARSRKISEKGKTSASEVKHTVQVGDTLWKIAQRYKVSAQELSRINRLKGNRISPGQVLIVKAGSMPASSASDAEDSEIDQDAPALSRRAGPGPGKAGSTSMEHTVRPEDTLWSIALLYKVDVDEIKTLNSLKDNCIQPGQVLRIAGRGNVPEPGSKTASPGKETVAQATAAPEKPAAAATEKQAPSGLYQVQGDDTLWKIARRFHVSAKALRQWNGLKNDRIKPGQTLKVAGPAGSAEPGRGAGSTSTTVSGKKPASLKPEAVAKTVNYQVQPGDTLWKISRRFKVDPASIRAWNAMKDNNIRPGDVLKILADQG